MESFDSSIQEVLKGMTAVIAAYDAGVIDADQYQAKLHDIVPMPDQAFFVKACRSGKDITDFCRDIVVKELEGWQGPLTGFVTIAAALGAAKVTNDLQEGKDQAESFGEVLGQYGELLKGLDNRPNSNDTKLAITVLISWAITELFLAVENA